VHTENTWEITASSQRFNRLQLMKFFFFVIQRYLLIENKTCFSG